MRDPQSQALLHSFYVAGGTLPPDALSYVERQADDDLLAALHQGDYCYVLNSRQMGKSSLCVRTIARLREEGTRTAFLDLTKFGSRNLTAEQWYAALLAEFGREVGLRPQSIQYWKQHDQLPPVQRFFNAIAELALADPGVQGKTAPAPELPNARTQADLCPLVVFIDEIDVTRSLPFNTDEFFAAIRQCYVGRATEPPLRRLTFCLLGTATPTELIEDTRITPFNIGRRIELRDFTVEEAAPLAVRLAGEGKQAVEGKALLHRILYWTSGHPYLTQRLCRAVAEDFSVTPPASHSHSPSVRVDRLCASLFLTHTAREGDDNLALVRNRLLKSEVDQAGLLELYGRVRLGNRIAADETDPLVEVLRLSGIVGVAGARRPALGVGTNARRQPSAALLWPLTATSRWTPDGCLQVRNRIYARVFDREWVRRHMPEPEVRRQRAAFRRGLVRSGAIASVILSLLAGLALVALQQRRIAEWRLERICVANGMRLAEEGDLPTALLWLAEALDLGQGDRHQQEANRARFAAVARQCPTLVRAWFHERTAIGAAVSADGRRVATVEEPDSVRVWDTTTGQAVGPPVRYQASVRLIALTPDGRRLLTLVSDRRAQFGDLNIRDVATGASTFPPFTLNNRATWGISASADGRLVAVTNGAHQVTQIWDAAVGQPLDLPLFPTDSHAILSVSPDSRRWLIVSKQSLQLWDSAGRRAIALPLLPGTRPPLAAFSPDGRRFVTANEGTIRQGSSSELRLWDATTGAPLSSLHRQPRRVYALALRPDNRTLATAVGYGRGDPMERCEVQFSDPMTGITLAPPLKPALAVRSLSFSPDGHFIATVAPNRTLGNGEIRVWDTATGESASSVLRHLSAVGQAAFTPGGRRIVVTSPRGETRLWEPFPSRNMTTLRHQECVSDAAFSPDGRLVATLAGQRTVRLWNANTGQPLSPLLEHTSRVSAVRFSRDGRRILLAGLTGTVFVRDAARGKAMTPSLDDSQAFEDAHLPAISPDGHHAVSTEPPSFARVRDLRTHRVTTPVLRHSAPVLYATFSPDGRRVVTGSEDGTARVWDASTGEPITLALRHNSSVGYAIFSGDGRRLLTASSDRTARVWDLSPDDRPVAELLLFARLLSGYRLDAAAGLVPLELAEGRDAWQRLRSR